MNVSWYHPLNAFYHNISVSSALGDLTKPFIYFHRPLFAASSVLQLQVSLRIVEYIDTTGQCDTKITDNSFFQYFLDDLSTNFTAFGQPCVHFHSVTVMRKTFWLIRLSFDKSYLSYLLQFLQKTIYKSSHGSIYAPKLLEKSFDEIQFFRLSNDPLESRDSIYQLSCLIKSAKITHVWQYDTGFKNISLSKPSKFVLGATLFTILLEATHPATLHHVTKLVCLL